MKFKKRLLIDVATGATLCGIFVAGIVAMKSDNFSSFSTPSVAAVTPLDCTMMCMGSQNVGVNGSCMCEYEMWMPGPDPNNPNEGGYCQRHLMRNPTMCEVNLLCNDPGTCVDPCEEPAYAGFPLCSEVAPPQCNITCKSGGSGPPGYATCTTSTVMMCQPGTVCEDQTCTGVCSVNNLDPALTELPDCDPGASPDLGESCACRKPDPAGSVCIASTNTCAEGMCDLATKTCKRMCEMTPGGCDNYRADCSTSPPSCVLDSVTIPTGNTSLAQCTAELPTSCPKYSLTCTGGAASCMPDTAGTYSTLSDCEAARTSPTPPITCSSSSSSSSADMCCNLVTQQCEPR